MSEVPTQPPKKKLVDDSPELPPSKLLPPEAQFLIKSFLNALVSLSKAGYKTVVSSGGSFEGGTSLEDHPI